MASTSCANTTVLILGILELILALGIVGCGVMDLVNKSRFYKMYHGIWGGGFLTVTALFAVFAGARKARGMHIAHMVMSILGIIFVIPGTSTLFALEGFSDYFYNYYTDGGDNSYCYQCWNGGYSSSSDSLYNYGLNYMATTTQSAWNFNYNSANNILGDVLCNDRFTGQYCHPNLKALRFEKLAIAFGAGLFLLFIISASFNCCAICACCGARNPGINPTEGVAVYPVATPYGMASNYPVNNGWNNQPISYSESSNYPPNGMQQYPPAEMQQYPQAGGQQYPPTTVVFT